MFLYTYIFFNAQLIFLLVQVTLDGTASSL